MVCGTAVFPQNLAVMIFLAWRGVLDLDSPKWGPSWGRSFPSRGGSRAPFVDAVWGKDLFEGFWKGILRNVYHGTPSQALPKGQPSGLPGGETFRDLTAT